MNELVKVLLSALPGMWQRRWIGLGVAWAIALLGGVIVSVIPDRYEASATVYVDTETVLKPLMSGLAVQPDINEQVAMIARTLVSRPNLKTVLRQPEFSKGSPTAFAGSEDSVIDNLIAQIKVNIDGREGIYSIKYRDQNPARAKALVQDLVNLFVQSGIGDKQRDSKEAQKFIDDQIAIYEQKLNEADARLKDFKVKNLGYTGKESVDFYTKISQLSEDLTQQRGLLHAAELSRDAIRRELDTEQPTMLPDSGGATPMSDTDQRLDAQRKALDDLLRRYTENHPDVIATRRAIAQLEQQKAREAEELRTGTRGGVKYSVATNPIYQKLKLSLADSEAQVAALEAKVGDLQARLNDLKSSAGRLPQIEEEYAQMNRDYDIIRKNYDQLVARREAASMSENVNASNQLADFRVIEPPRVSPHPVPPGRFLLILGVLVAALAGGVATCFQLSYSFPTYDTARALREAIKRPVLGGVTRMVGPGELERERRDRILLISGVVLLAMVDVVWAGINLLLHKAN